jgi:phage shock protein A
MSDLASIQGASESLADILASENAVLEQEVTELKRELEEQRRVIAHLRVELGEMG